MVNNDMDRIIDIFGRQNCKEMSSYYMIDSYVRIFLLHICRPMLLHRMTLVSFRMFRKNLGNLGEVVCANQFTARWQKIARTPMTSLARSSSDLIKIKTLHFSGFLLELL